MNFKKIFLNNENILKDGIFFTNVDWQRLAVWETTKNFEGLHGRIVSPTLVRNRIITMEGIIDRLDGNDELEKISHLERIFALQWNTARLEEKEMVIIDQFDREWKILVKIKTPLEFDEWDANLKGSHWKWRVVLESTTLPYYTSKNPIVITGGRNGRYGGIKFGNKGPNAWNSSRNAIILDAGNIAVPIKFTIRATADIASPITIKNITGKSIFVADISAVAGDEIIIDSEAFLITKNGINISDSRFRGSAWQQVKWMTKFIISDKNESVEKNMEISVEFSKILL